MSNGDMRHGEMVVLTGNANRPLAEDVCRHMQIPLGEAQVGMYADGEIRAKIGQNVRGRDVFMIQPTHPPTDNLFELLIMIDALRRASAERITVVLPYYGYSRQERKAESRVAITAKLVADLIVAAGGQRILSLDLHAPAIQGFVNIPFDQLYALPRLAEQLSAWCQDEKKTVISVDPGNTKIATAAARMMGARVAHAGKSRSEDDDCEVDYIEGEVAGQTVLMVDDLIGTGKTIVEVAKLAHRKGAARILVAATHGIFSYHKRSNCWAAQLIDDSPIENVAVTDTVPLGRVDPQYGQQPVSHKVKVVTVADLLGSAIERIHNDQSVSEELIPEECRHM